MKMETGHTELQRQGDSKTGFVRLTNTECHLLSKINVKLGYLATILDDRDILEFKKLDFEAGSDILSKPRTWQI